MAYDPADLRLPPWLLRLLDWLVRIDISIPPCWRIGVTRPGALYIGALFGVWAAAFYSGNNLLYLCGSMLIALAAASLWRSVHLLRRVPRIAPALPKYVEAGRREMLKGVLSAAFTEAAVVDVKWHTLHGELLSGQLKLSKKGVLSAQFYSKKRGLASFQQLELSTSFPLGLWRIIRIQQDSGSLFIMPQAVSWHDALGDARRLEQGDEWYGLREYVSGDSLSRVHWRKVRSTDSGWTVKRFDRSEPHDQQQLLRVDLRLPQGMGEQQFERLLGKAWYWFLEQLPNSKDGDLLILGQRSFNLGDSHERDAAISALASARPDSSAPMGSGGIALSLMEDE